MEHIHKRVCPPTESPSCWRLYPTLPNECDYPRLFGQPDILG
jgi:hypothetical protein